MKLSLYQGDSREKLKLLADNSVDAVVTDPPYELGFMGRSWDSTGIAYSVELWTEVLRALKPGGHLLSFGGTRTYHRMACAIEDAGFEIRDQMQWLYGTGFPKSLDVSKAIDKSVGAERKVIGKSVHSANRGKTKGNGETICREGGDISEKEGRFVTAPATAAAARWNGWGTALKPANEPICVARKPLSEPTVAANVLRWGTGALNIDATRISVAEDDPNIRDPSKHIRTTGSIWGNANGAEKNLGEKGRFPANVILDEEAGKLLNKQSGIGQSGDFGGASRFFYCAKASSSERGEFNTHATVKPIKLIEYLIRLVTPPNGVVLDPFLGSGTAALAAQNLAPLVSELIGIELEQAHMDIVHQRLLGDLWS